MTAPLWQPSPETTAATQMAALMRHIEAKHGAQLHDYADLHAWSIEYPERFWSLLWDTFEIVAEHRGEPVLESPDAMPGAAGSPRPGSTSPPTCCAAETRRRPDRPRRARARRELSHAELYRRVARLARALRDDGVEPGDRLPASSPTVSTQ